MRKFVLVLVSLVVGLVLTPAAASTAHAIPPDAPCTVATFSTHARLQMAVRDYSEWEVRNAVKVSCNQNKVTKQANGTFKYAGTYVGVVMDWRRNVVTVFSNTGGGGGGGGWSVPSEYK
jgi:hypothetical protein